MSFSELPHYQFLHAHLGLLLTTPKGRRFYRILLKKLLTNSLHDESLRQLHQELQPQLRLVNILFDEVKLTETLRYSGGHVAGYALNGFGDAEVLATHTLVIEIVCHFGALNIL